MKIVKAGGAGAPATHVIVDSGTTSVSNFPATQPVSGTVAANAGTNLNTSALALEAGHLATIDTSTAKIPAQGQALAAGSLPVVLTAAQQTAPPPPAAITGFALEAGHAANIDTATARIPAQGQALAAASMPVILPAATITTLTPPAAITGFALDSTVAKDGADITTPTAMPAGGVGIRGWLSAIWTKLNGTIAVTGTFWQATQPVSGTFWQATQPVSGTVAVSSLPATPAGTNVIGHVINDASSAVIGHVIADSGSTTAVTSLPAIPAGTNVIGHVIADTGSTTAVTALPAIPAGTNVIGHVIVDTAPSTAVTNAGTFAVQAALNAETTKVIGTVNPPAITKGTQGATGFTVQDLKDSGRKYIVITLDTIAGITTEALATMSINAGGTVTSATQYTVTAGKTLRLQFFGTSVKNTSTVATDSRVRVRTAATVAATSPIIVANECGTPAAVANVGATDESPFPDGLEIAAGQQIGISHIESATTSTVSANLIGYEY